VTSGVLNSCSAYNAIVEYVIQVITLALILGLALRLSRWERDGLSVRNSED